MELADNLSTLEKRKDELDKILRSAKEEQKALDELIKSYEMKLNNVNTEAKEIRVKAKNDAMEFVDTLKTRVEQLIRSIRESNASKESLADVLS